MTGKKKQATTGRPKAPPRDLAGIRLEMPRPLRDRLTAQANKETVHNRLGLIVSSTELAIRLIDEGLTRCETATS
jgi:hypothetical protein